MAVTEFGTNDNLTRKVWAKKLYKSALEETFINRLMGTKETAILQRVTDLENDGGDVVHYSYLPMLTGAGVDGDDEIVGREQELTFHRASVGIEQKRQGVAFRRMSMQRHVNDLRGSTMDVLGKWYARKYDQYALSYLAGQAHEDVSAELSTTAASSFAGNALLAPDDAHHINHATETLHGKSTDGAGAFSVDYIEEAVTVAKTSNPIMQPANFGGTKAYVAILHPYAVHSMRVESGTNKWREIVSQARERSAQNPIFQDAIGMWNGVIILESNNVPYNSTTAVTHNVLLGQGAGVIAFGNAYSKLDKKKVRGGSLFSWFEENGDADNRKGIYVGSIFGLQKNQFNSADHAVIKIAADDAAPV